MSEENRTFVERVFGSFFSAQSKDAKGFILVVLTMYSIWITRLYIVQNDSLNAKIVEEVRKQVQPAVKEQIEPIQQKVDTATQVVKSVSSNIDEFIKKQK